mmetsp:Transcript_1267/g.2670  ORF Transcript_1267/g.2670 Transcript_1267/m.2670 type:complete len:99 (-) Transcript_1267:1026-1322(-)
MKHIAKWAAHQTLQAESTKAYTIDAFQRVFESDDFRKSVSEAIWFAMFGGLYRSRSSKTAESSSSLNSESKVDVGRRDGSVQITPSQLRPQVDPARPT